MANTSVFTGADGSISLSVSQGAEGDSANGVISQYAMTVVGRVQNVRVEVRSDVRAFYEIGQRYPTELRPGNISINGTIGRGYINGALLKLLLGDAASQRPAGNFVQPAFNITLMVDSPSTTGDKSTVTIHDVKINNWSYTLPEDDFVVEAAAFQALYITVEDETQ